MNRKIAFMYDFDRTLCTKDMQNYGFIPGLGMSDSEFWSAVGVQTVEHQMDPILSYLYSMVTASKRRGLPLTRAYLNSLGQGIELYPGVDTWFDRVNAYGNSRNIEIEHYVISSGLEEIIEGSAIADKFKRIYASRFHYDENGLADWPSVSSNYTNKTQFLFRIHKGIMDVSDDRINEYMPDEEIAVPYPNLVYFGDGMTDVPCMSLVKRNGGTSLAVYAANTEAPRKLMEQNRVNFAVPADYSKGSRLEKIIFRVTDKVAFSEDLKSMQETEKEILHCK